MKLEPKDNNKCPAARLAANLIPREKGLTKNPKVSIRMKGIAKILSVLIGKNIETKLRPFK